MVISIKELVAQSTTKFKDEVAFQIKEGGTYKEYTYAQVGEQVQKLRQLFSKLGIERGDRIALLSENRPAWPITYLGIVSYGAAVVPLDAMLKAEDWLYLLSDSGAKAIFLSEKFTDLIPQIKQQVPAVKNIISLDHEEGPSVFAPEGEAKVDLEDIASIVYTSGTTGLAKGVMLTHRNIMSNVQALSQMFAIGPGDNFLSVLPLHHTFETTTGFLAPLYMGAKITYVKSLKSYVLLAAMRETKVTIMVGVPLLYQLFYDGIVREIKEKGLLMRVMFRILLFVSRLVKLLARKNIGKILFKQLHDKLGGKIKFWVSGAAPIDAQVIKNFDLMGITVLQGYGLTESAPVLAACDLAHNRMGAVGRAVSGVEVKIKDPDKNGVGEIIARGPNIMKGYYKKPEVTSEIIRNGWLYTGDLGYIDRDGYVYVSGRAKDLIVTGSGKNIYPEEVEIGLNKSPFIKESCVLGMKVKTGVRKGMEDVWGVIVPDPDYFAKYGQENKIVVDDKLIENKIKEEVDRFNQRVAEYKRIAGFKIQKEEFPKTSTRKIRRFKVKAQWKT